MATGEISIRLRLSRVLHTRLARQANDDGCSLNGHMVRLLGEGSDRHDREATTMATTTSNAPTGDPRDLDSDHWTTTTPLDSRDGVERMAVCSDAGERWIAVRRLDRSGWDYEQAAVDGE